MRVLGGDRQRAGGHRVSPRVSCLLLGRAYLGVAAAERGHPAGELRRGRIATPPCGMLLWGPSVQRDCLVVVTCGSPPAGSVAVTTAARPKATFHQAPKNSRMPSATRSSTA